VDGCLTMGLMGGFRAADFLGVGYKHVGRVLNGRCALKFNDPPSGAETFAVANSYASGKATATYSGPDGYGRD